MRNGKIRVFMALLLAMGMLLMVSCGKKDEKGEDKSENVISDDGLAKVEGYYTEEDLPTIEQISSISYIAVNSDEYLKSAGTNSTHQVLRTFQLGWAKKVRKHQLKAMKK